MVSNATVSQFNGEKGDLEAESSQLISGQFPEGTYQTFGVTGVVAFHDTPVKYEGKKIVFDPDAMRPNFPYTFRMFDHNMAAIKSSDGTMDFYYFPNPEDIMVLDG